MLAGLILTLSPVTPLPGQVVTPNAVPGRTIAIYLAHLDDPFWVRQLLGNVALLLPIGFVGPIATRVLDRWWRVGFACVCLLWPDRDAQLAIPNRAGDVDDVLVNVLGALLGFALWRLLRPVLSRYL